MEKEENTKILRLPISEPWFSMILSGEKTEEYRDLTPFYTVRLDKKPTEIELTNGYGHHRPALRAKISAVKVGVGREKWGAPKAKVYKICIGEILETRNLK